VMSVHATIAWSRLASACASVCSERPTRRTERARAGRQNARAVAEKQTQTPASSIKHRCAIPTPSGRVWYHARARITRFLRTKHTHTRHENKTRVQTLRDSRVRGVGWGSRPPQKWTS
jgi:hypothetical protein